MTLLSSKENDTRCTLEGATEGMKRKEQARHVAWAQGYPNARPLNQLIEGASNVQDRVEFSRGMAKERDHVPVLFRDIIRAGGSHTVCEGSVTRVELGFSVQEQCPT